MFDSSGGGNNINLGSNIAESINDNGEIVGWLGLVALLFDPNGSGNNMNLGYGRALSINNSGEIVGQSHGRATVFDPTGGGENTDLGGLGRAGGSGKSTNNRGRIVGSGETNFEWPQGWPGAPTGYYFHATLFSTAGDGNNIDLGALIGDNSESCASSINNNGQIVGWADTGAYERHAMVFDPTGGDNMDLNNVIEPALGWTLKEATCINDNGWIAGCGVNRDGEERAFLLTPVPRTYYVDADANGANNGTAWADAYNYLEDALAVAEDGNDVWVAEGIYKPDQNSADPNGTGDRYGTFQLINGVGLYGGFAGGETSLDGRDWQTNVTILSGDINTPGDNSDNSYHVVTGTGTDGTAILDGFTITGGNASGSWPDSTAPGGGMVNHYSSSPTVTNCTFTGNSAGSWGGGMYNCDDSDPTVTNCTFSRNSARWEGGGMYNFDSSPVITNCTFSGNWADFDGGGIYNSRNPR